VHIVPPQQCRMCHQDSHQEAPGLAPRDACPSVFVAARRLPYPPPIPQAPPPPPSPFAVATARPYHQTLAHAPAEARHQHGVPWHPDASEQHHPPASVGDALSYRKHAMPPLRAE